MKWRQIVARLSQSSPADLNNNPVALPVGGHWSSITPLNGGRVESVIVSIDR